MTYYCPRDAQAMLSDPWTRQYYILPSLTDTRLDRLDRSCILHTVVCHPPSAIRHPSMASTFLCRSLSLPSQSPTPPLPILSSYSETGTIARLAPRCLLYVIILRGFRLCATYAPPYWSLVGSRVVPAWVRVGLSLHRPSINSITSRTRPVQVFPPSLTPSRDTSPLPLPHTHGAQ